ncbi:PREDICTED: uncharacterized protein LOC109482127 [Branchiostoma belcheri]|uniref:Uncharacterized protein LOC109482127 n=1 Tax=Branchiostoma belcheri TaxID=7741 RepID=A0A6P5A1Z7_BRABE|nr:PREDICTED: uncharacterized protein LOC109482127 [Branchiostoma belcheri]
MQTKFTCGSPLPKLARKMKLTISIFLFLGLLWVVHAGYPRLHFAGNFLADTPTLNNDPVNFNINTFNASRNPPCYINYTGDCDWNPNGSGDFRFVNCSVTKVCYKDGKCSQGDPLVGKRIIGSDDTVAGKIVDLDPFIELVTTQLWGLVVGVEDAFQGKFKTNTVMDIWQRCKKPWCPGDPRPGRSGYWSSILTDVTWMDVDIGSTFINELRYSQQGNGILNIKFTVDLMQEDSRRPNYTLGRVVGTISAVDGSLDPEQYIPEFNRMMWWQGPQWLSPNVPRESPENSTYWNAPFYVDDVSKKVVVDLSNSLPTNLEGDLLDQGSLFLVVLHQQPSSLTIVEGRIMDCNTLLAPCCTNLGRIPYTNPGFLLKNSGIATFCLRPLAQKYPLMIVREEKVSCPDSEDCPKQCTPILVERQDGLYIGPAGDRVFRIPQPKTENPPSKPHGAGGISCWSSKVFATQFGKPKAGVGLSIQPYDRQNTGEPADVIDIIRVDCSGYAKPNKTNAYGIAAFTFVNYEGGLDCSRRPPNRPAYLLGQLYIYKMTLSGDNSFPPNLLTSTHLYCKINKKENYTWDEDIYPILKLYENLYPVMKPLFNLASKDEVQANSDHLHYAMSLPIESPNHMPVTRDLSPAKRDMILEWLKPSEETPDTAQDLEINNQLEVILPFLRTALTLEWATIPPYLSAYYSIKDGYNKEIAMLLKSIVIEEMTHLSMVANILNFLGEAPNFTNQTLWPKYPGKLPGGVMPNLTVGLARFSKQVTHDVFMGIETPECDPDLLEVHRLLWQIPPRVRPAEIPQQCQNIDNNANCDPLSVNILQKCTESNYNMSTIGALYIHRILCPMIYLYMSHPGVFAPKKENLDKQVPIPFCVLDICSAIEGIKYIIGEGEGGDPCNPFFEEELSHYYKFKEIWKGKQLVAAVGNSSQSCTSGSCDNNPDDQSPDTDPFTPCNDVHCSKNYTFTGPIIPFNEEGVWPTLPNPSTSHYPPGSRARILSDSFNLKYTNLMTCLHETFNGNPGQFSQCYALMTSLTVDAKRLVQTNLTATDDVYGAPTFEWYSRDGNN